MRISRHYSDDHISEDIFETRLAIYEDQVRGWFHDQARILEKASDHAGFVLLMIAISYVEGYAIFWKGENSRHRSREFFRDACKEIFPLTTEANGVVDDEVATRVADELYDQVRCGLFHTGMTRGKVVLSGGIDHAVAINVHNETGEVVRININPHKVLDRIEGHFSSYVMRLRNPHEEELRSNFNDAWNLRAE
jgi:hypothetical protein